MMAPKARESPLDSGLAYRKGMAIVSSFLDPSAQSADELTLSARRRLRLGIELLTDSLRTDPSNASAHWYLAKCYQILGMGSAAVASFRTAYRLAPDTDAIAWTEPGSGSDDEVHAGNTVWRDRMLQDGLSLLSPILDYDSRARVRISKQRHPELMLGLELLEKVAHDDPECWQAQWGLGRGYQWLEQHSQACAAFREAYRLQPENAEIARGYSIECLETGDTSTGVMAAVAAVKLRPEDAALRCELAAALLLRGQVREALEAVEEALLCARAHADVLDWAREYDGGALEAVEEALLCDPQYETASELQQVIRDVIDGVRPAPRTASSLWDLARKESGGGGFPLRLVFWITIDLLLILALYLIMNLILERLGWIYDLILDTVRSVFG